LEPKTKRVALATLFGGCNLLSKTIVPSPIDKMFIAIHALLHALGALLLRRMGATYVALIGSVLTALWRTALAPFTFVFALWYGLFVDVFFFIFKANHNEGNVRIRRLVASMTVSTGLLELISYYITVFILGLLQRNPMLEVSILIIGTLNGTVAGCLASILWNKYLKNVKF
jgi:fatty acid desaturase